MTVGLVMIVKDEARWLQPTLLAVKPLIDHWTIVDTGSTDGTQALARGTMEGVPGELHERPWRSFGENLTEALEIAIDTADWLLRLDADWRVDYVPDFRPWLDQDTCPEVDAWNVELYDSGTRWRLPILMRGGIPWRYLGPCHEYLDTAGRNQRDLLGLQITHMRPGGSDPTRFQSYIDLLADGVADGEPRATFYSAESLRFLGRTEEAINMYRRRYAIASGFEEERWYAGYQAARLASDVNGLIDVWRQRPHRHEPLSAAARIIGESGGGADVLFKEEIRL